MALWLMKSEPDVFGIDDLKKSPNQTAGWDGVRNYQARNFMRQMKAGDGVLFYHSNATPSGLAGLAVIAAEAQPDPTQFDPASHYHDPKSDPAKPRWDWVTLQYVRHFKRLIPLTELKTYPELADLPLVQKGTRLSVHPVSQHDWDFILSIE
ncbi:MAG: EVE domain-containing protein [Gammaproteobacteria bacterium]|nr:EVE domain-containing protein [Gammaproteobacteria bacterium]